MRTNLSEKVRNLLQTSLHSLQVNAIVSEQNIILRPLTQILKLLADRNLIVLDVFLNQSCTKLCNMVEGKFNET